MVSTFLRIKNYWLTESWLWKGECSWCLLSAIESIPAVKTGSTSRRLSLSQHMAHLATSKLSALCSFIRHTNCVVNTQLITILVWLCHGKVVGLLQWCFIKYYIDTVCSTWCKYGEYRSIKVNEVKLCSSHDILSCWSLGWEDFLLLLFRWLLLVCPSGLDPRGALTRWPLTPTMWVVSGLIPHVIVILTCSIKQ